MTRTSPGGVNANVYGTAGVSLDAGADVWARNASTVATGKRGEKRTERLLNRLADELSASSIAVLHDLASPARKLGVNVDHALVVGSWVTLIDSKVWLPGTYWSLGSRAFRGTTRVEHVERTSLSTAQRTFARSVNGAGGTLTDPVTLVWSSGDAPVRLAALRGNGSRVLNAHRIEALVNSGQSWRAMRALAGLPHATIYPRVRQSIVAALARNLATGGTR